MYAHAGDRAGRRDRRSRRAHGRGGHGLRGAGARRTRRRPKRHRLVPRAHGQLQGAAPGRDRGRAAAERVGQGDEVRAARARARPAAARDRQRDGALGAGRGARRGDARRRSSRSTSATRTLDFAGYRDAALRAAAGLAARGVGAGDAASRGCCRPRSRRWCCARALARLGAVQNPILPIYREREVRFIARQTRRAAALRAGRLARLRLRGDGARARGASSRGLEVLVVDGALPDGDPARAAAGAARRSPAARAGALASSTPRARPPTRRARDTPTRRCWRASAGMVRVLELGARRPPSRWSSRSRTSAASAG